MPFDARRNLLFVHIPKNAGKSLEVALGFATAREQRRYKWRSTANRAGTAIQRYTSDPAASRRLWGIVDVTLAAQHLTLQEISLLNLVPVEAMRSANILAIVRDPYSRAISTYLHWRRSTKPPTSVEFEHFWEYWPKREPRNHNELAHRRTQVDYLRDQQGQVAVKNIIRYERMHDELDRWARRTDVKMDPLPHIGDQGLRSERADLYTAKSRNRVSGLYRDDFDTFGYDLLHG